MRDDEVRIPNGVSYFKRSKGEVPIDGVIKTERIEFFDDDEISKPLTSVNLDTKIEVLERYKNTMGIPYFIRKMNEESPGHKEAMQTFERAIIAEKLGFLATDLGECKYEHMEDFVLKVYKIQSLGQSNSNKRIHFYSVELTDENRDSFFYTFATMKKPNQIARDWGKSKTAADWLREDERFYILKKNLHKHIYVPPLPHPNKYMSFSIFQQRTQGMER